MLFSSEHTDETGGRHRSRTHWELDDVLFALKTGMFWGRASRW